MITRHQDGKSSPHYIQQHPHTLRIVEPFQFPDKFRERACKDSHALAIDKFTTPAQHTALIAGGAQRLHDTNRRRCRYFPTHDQPGDAVGSIDAPPAFTRDIKADEEVIREKWYENRLKLPRVPPRLHAPGQKNRIGLIFEMRLRGGFAVGKTLYGIPPPRHRQIRVIGTALPPFSHPSYPGTFRTLRYVTGKFLFLIQSVALS